MKETVDSINSRFQALLHGPLQFGNDQQIKVLREWRRALDVLEEEQAAKDSGVMRLWRVGFSYRTYNKESVEATCRDEAEDIVREDYDHNDDFEIESVRLVNK